MAHNTQLSKWGNSLAVRIPKTIVEEARLTEGDQLSLKITQDGDIVMRTRPRKYKLQELVSRITSRNRHAETDWGGPAGRESW